MEELVLRYSHNIVEHLGLKLYQNQPTRVIAELISNAWDADAGVNQINTNMVGLQSDRWVAVLDNGNGMSRALLRDEYLVIGHRKRAKPGQRSVYGRPLMGRKGIGKLAAFGIARFVDVVTAHEEGSETKVHWIRFDRDELLGKGEEDHTYHPQIIADGVPFSKLPMQHDSTGQVKKWIDFVDGGSGTVIVMTNLSLMRAISEQQLQSSIGSRFTLAVSGKMDIIINGRKVNVENSLPKFEFRIPAEGVVQEVLESGKEIRYWVGFVESADWPQDQAGIGVYAHEKIAQDRPFVFGLKGREIYTRYMFGVIEADWLDELDHDIISTDRTSINWEVDEVAELYERGQALARSWISDFSRWREKKARGEAEAIYKKVQLSGKAANVTATEEAEIVNLASSITASFGKGREKEKEQLMTALSDAWIQEPMRKLVKDLWTNLGEHGDAPPEAFTTIVERLSAHSVPESLNLSVVFAQRAFAITRLQNYVHHGNETNLQKLIERFPWIIEPDTAVLSADKSLKSAAEEAERRGQIPTGRRAIVGGVTDNKKPDFIFLSSPSENQIVVVELKNPQEDLTIDNRAQLQDYMTWVEAHYPNADLRGYLVGRSSGLVSHDTRVSIIPWTKVLGRARDRNLELLSAMLLLSGSTEDARAVAAIDLGGPAAEALLERLAKDHAEIAELMRTFQKVRDSNECSAS